MVAENIEVTSHDIGPRWQAGQVYTVKSQFTIGSAVETGDSWTLSDLLPTNDYQVLSGEVYGAEFDTNSSPTATLIVGDGTDTDGYLTSKVAGSALGQMRLKFDGALLADGQNPASNDVTLTLGGSVATAASSGTVHVEITYYCG